LQKIVYTIIILAVIVSSCSTARKANGRGEERAVEDNVSNSLESVISNNLSNHDFYIRRADIRIRQENVTVNLNASVKFRRPDSLMISIRSSFGVEAGKGFLTSDTVMINDRFNRKLMVGDPEELRAKYGIDPAMIFVILGDMIVSKVDNRSMLNCQRGEFSRRYNVGGRTVEYTVDCQRRKVKKVYLEGDVRTGNITILLSDIIRSGNISYPGKVIINDDLMKLDLEIEIRRIDSPWQGSMGGVGGSGYRVVRIR
jgi:hypothetical protein